jgi:hypothetical protein
MPAGCLHRVVGRRFGLCALAAAVILGCALPATQAAVAVHSRSGQFIVHSPDPTPPSLARVGPPNTNSVLTLYPDPLAVSCERIKAAVLAELGLPDRWQGKVHVTIDPRAPPETFPTAVARRYGDGWHYSLRLPREIEGAAVVRGVVHAVLLDLANGSPGPNLPEVPLWLVEALTGQVLSRVGADPLARPNQVTGKYGNALGQLVATLSERGLAEEDRRVLNLARAHGLLTFEEISLPTPERLSGPALEHYRACCQILFVALRNLPHGSQRLAALLARLPRYLNWQTAFLDVYAPVFPRLLDLEKWWALTAQRLGATAGEFTLPARLGVAWLEDLVIVDVVVRTARNAPPQRRRLSLQQILTEWDYPNQRAIFMQRSQALRRLAASMPGDVRALVEGYASVLENYLAGRDRLRYQPGLRGQGPALLANLVANTVARLAALDARRRELSPPPAQPALKTATPTSPTGSVTASEAAGNGNAN